MRCPNCNWEFPGGSFCPRCGKAVRSAPAFCPKCGKPADGFFCSSCGAELQPPSSYRNPYDPAEFNCSDKKKWTAFFLCLFLGGLGIHRFYVGKVGTGIVWLLLCVMSSGLWTIAVLVDLIMIVMGKFKDKNGRYLR